MLREEKIEILSVSMLDKHRSLVEALKRRARSLRLGLGWHYLLDLTWILVNLGPATGKRIMDAGAGTGLLQWVLAEQGAEVVSVDRSSRASLPVRFRSRYKVKGLRREDLHPTPYAVRKSVCQAKGISGKVSSTLRAFLDLLRFLLPKQASGGILIYNQDLKTLSEIDKESMDGVVAVSALEHNAPDELALVVDELMRVLKPGGVLLATLGAAQDKDWFHAPSQGWCYTDVTLRRNFGLSHTVVSNYDRYDEYFAALKDCAELRDALADFYFHSGDSGMPWGKWDPKYQPVGVCKVKPAQVRI